MRFLDLKSVVYPREVFREQRRRHFLQRARRIDAASRKCDRIGIEVRRKNPDRHRFDVVDEKFGERDREGVCFFAGGTTRGPEPQLGAIVASVLDNIRQYAVAELSEKSRVPKKLGHFDQKRADQPLVCLGMRGQVPQVILERFAVRRCHEPGKASHDRGSLILPKVNTGASSQLAEKCVENVWIGYFAVARPGGQRRNQRRERVETRRVVDVAKRNRSRQRRKRSGFGLLHQHRTSAFLDSAHTRHTVGAHSGENERYDAVAVAFGGAHEERVDRRNRMAAEPAASVHARAAHGYVFARRSEVNRRRHEIFAALRNANNFQVRLPAKYVAEMALKVRDPHVAR